MWRTDVESTIGLGAPNDSGLELLHKRNVSGGGMSCVSIASSASVAQSVAESHKPLRSGALSSHTL